MEKSAGAEDNEQNEAVEEVSKEKAPAKAEENSVVSEDTDNPVNGLNSIYQKTIHDIDHIMYQYFWKDDKEFIPNKEARNKSLDALEKVLEDTEELAKEFIQNHHINDNPAILHQHAQFMDEFDEIYAAIDNDDKKFALKLALSRMTLHDGFHTTSNRSLGKSDEKEFIVSPNGSIELGKISQEIARATNDAMDAVAVRLQVGNENFGLIHVILRHEAAIEKKGYNPISFIQHILHSFNQIYYQPNRGKEKRFVLYVQGDKSKGFMPLDLEFEKDDEKGYYTIVTAMVH